MKEEKSFLGACLEVYEQRTFLKAYHDTFELVRADNDALKEAVFRLRYDVFCEENKFEKPPVAGKELEFDAYDDRAVHYLLMHRLSGDAVGTLRVTLPSDEHPGESFLAQQHCTHPLLKYDSRALSLCEVSRFCTAKRFRKRDRDGRLISAYYDQDVVEALQDGQKKKIRRLIPYAPAALWQGAFETALSARITDCVWLVDSCHLTSLERIGFPFSTLGPLVKYHGGAQPVVFNIKNVLDTMRRKNRHIWDVVSDLGRLQKIADDLHQNDWQDNLLDEASWDASYDQGVTDFRDLR
jgi:N-acyl amino acid synthase of PEP-CTERM/exosortase system